MHAHDYNGRVPNTIQPIHVYKCITAYPARVKFRHKNFPLV
jgi:hypothetical protein